MEMEMKRRSKDRSLQERFIKSMRGMFQQEATKNNVKLKLEEREDKNEEKLNRIDRKKKTRMN
eukprot:snap_masked-scaffold_21-processed-gene-3.40-mRNA-1 protein AED:1.00 eAED:1.00 QI:0/0/0/0/1/1/2/0/62